MVVLNYRGQEGTILPRKKIKVFGNHIDGYFDPLLSLSFSGMLAIVSLLSSDYILKSGCKQKKTTNKPRLRTQTKKILL